MRDFTLPLDVSVKKRIHYDGAARVGEQLTAQPDQSAAWDFKLDAHPPIAVVVHVDHLSLARAQLFHHNANESFRDVHREMFDRFHQLAIDTLGDDLGLAYHQLVAFAAHHLNRNGELQLTASQNFEGVGGSSFLDAKRHVGEQFLVEALTQVSRGHICSFASCKGRIVYGKQNCDRRLVNRDMWQGRGVVYVGDSFADGNALHTGDGDDVAQFRLGNVGALQAAEGEQLGDFCLVQRSI